MDILTQTIPYPVQIDAESALAAFQIYLHRYLQQERVVVVFPSFGETGVMLSVVMTDLDARQKFADVVAQVRQTLQTEKIPWDGENANVIESAPRFQVAFHFHDGNHAPPYLLAGKLPGTILELECVHSGKSLETHWYFNQAWYKADEVARMAACFGVFLQNLLDAPEKPCVSIPLLTADEQQARLVDWNRTAAEYPREATIHSLIEAQVERSPDAIAATYEGKKITYAELERRANRIAQALLSVGILPGTPIGLYIDRDLDMLAAQIGILKAGAAYAALDTHYPREMLARLFGIIELPVILTQSHLAEQLPENQAKILLLDDQSWLGAFPETRPLSPVRAESAAFIIFTSGSTGLPKGVIHTHRNMVARFHAAWALAALESTEAFSQTSPLSSIDGVDEIFQPLMRGARVVMIPHRVVTDPYRLVEILEREEVTRIILVPSLLRIILALEEENLSQRLRKLVTWLIGGEPLTNAMAHMFYQRLPHARLVNFYGLTEGDALYHLVRPQVDYPVAPPIGRPVQNTRVYLLDETLNPVPVGVSGEICLAGEGLFREYYRRPDLNSQKWIPNPFVPADDPFYARLFKTGDIGRLTPEGEVEYVGRRDRMVKIRSFRVELGEVEAALYLHPSVKECVVAAREIKPTASANSALTRQVRLAGYVVTKPGTTVTPLELRQFLRDLLPDYALPAAIMLLEKLPLSPNGKVDVAALPETSEFVDMEENFVAPRDPLEVEIADIWSTLLQRHPIGVNDNFFDIGGDSLAAVDLVLRIEKKYRRSLPISVLLQSPTIEQLADLLRSENRQARWSSLVPIQPNGHRPPLFCVHADGGVLFYYNFAHLMEPERPIYGIQARGLLGTYDAPMASIEAMAAHYISEIRTVQAHGPYHLCAFSAGGLVIFEMARQLREMGEQVAFVGLLDAYGPGYPELLPGKSVAEYKLSVHLNTLRLHGLFGQLDYLWRRTRKRVGIIFSNLTGDLLTRLRLPLPHKVRYNYIARMIDQASEHYYDGQTYAGEVVLFRASIQPEGIKPDPNLGWGGLVTGDLHIIDVTGTHNSIMKEPHLLELVHALEVYLARLAGKA